MEQCIFLYSIFNFQHTAVSQHSNNREVVEGNNTRKSRRDTFSLTYVPCLCLTDCLRAFDVIQVMNTSGNCSDLKTFICVATVNSGAVRGGQCWVNLFLILFVGLFDDACVLRNESNYNLQISSCINFFLD